MRFQIAAGPLAALGLAVLVGTVGPAGSGAALAATPVVSNALTAEELPAMHSPSIDSFAPRQKSSQPYSLEIGGHRAGVDQAPENTLAAVRKAVELGADSVELDVRFTADSKPVILHDDTLERTTDCSGFVSAWKLSALLRCDAGAWFSQAFSDERVPTLDEVLEELDSTDLVLYLHVKLVDTITQAATLVGAVATSDMATERVVYVADEHPRLEALALAGVPMERLAWVVHRMGDFDDRHPRYGALVVHCPQLKREMVQRVQKRGQRIIAVEGFPITFEQSKELKLDGILADNLKAALVNR